MGTFHPPADDMTVYDAAALNDGDGSNTFRAFNPTQAEETYSMVTANRFRAVVFKVALQVQSAINLQLRGIFTNY